MGIKVTQLSGVYHVFLRTRLFLSTHFRAHVSPGRSKCKQEVHGLEGLRQVSQQQSNTFYSCFVLLDEKKKTQWWQNVPKYSLLFCELILTDFTAFLFCTHWSPRVSILSVTFNFFMPIPDHFGDKKSHLFVLHFFFLSKKSVQSGIKWLISFNKNKFNISHIVITLLNVTVNRVFQSCYPQSI